jgi:hypothetical protein
MPGAEARQYIVGADEMRVGNRRWSKGDAIDRSDLQPEAWEAAIRCGQIREAGDPIPSRAKRWKGESDRILAQLDHAQRAILARARAGAAPVILSFPAHENDAKGSARALDMIEAAARAMLRAYEWPDATGDYPPHGWREQHQWNSSEWRPVGPDWTPDVLNYSLEYSAQHDRLRRWPCYRGELLRLIWTLAELRAARAAGHIDSAVLLSMTTGMMLCRLAFSLINGRGTAEAAAARLKRPLTHVARRENLNDRLAPRDEEIRRLDAKYRDRYPYRESRAKRIKPLLDRWIEAYNATPDLPEADKQKPIAWPRIRDLLPN